MSTEWLICECGHEKARHIDGVHECLQCQTCFKFSPVFGVNQLDQVCACGHMRGYHGIEHCLVAGCRCPGFQLPPEKPPFVYSPTAAELLVLCALETEIESTQSLLIGSFNAFPDRDGDIEEWAHKRILLAQEYLTRIFDCKRLREQIKAGEARVTVPENPVEPNPQEPT